MKKLKTLIGAGIITLSSCTNLYNPCVPVPQEIGDTPLEIMDWIYNNIEPSVSKTIQTGKKTWEEKKGDCLDMSRLFEYFVERRCGGNAKICYIFNYDGAKHAVVEYEELYYDCTVNRTYEIGFFGEQKTIFEIIEKVYFR